MAKWISLLCIIVLGIAKVATVGPNAYDYLVELVNEHYNDKTHSCNGVIIQTGTDKTYVLTAAHCTINRNLFKKPNKVYCGSYGIRPKDVDGAPALPITNDAIHFKRTPTKEQPVIDPACLFDSKCYWPHDMALLEINDPCHNGERINIYSGDMNTLLSNTQTQDCWITAWQGGDDENIKAIQVVLVDGAEVNQNFPSTCALMMNGKIPKHTVCTISPECIEVGNSGGPLVCKHGTNYELVAIVSIGPTQAGECIPNMNVAHTIVNAYRANIENVTGTLP